ncbi:MAG: hypothetical protein ACREI1_07550, partial [Nitrospiraceae bacterium]
LPITSISFSLKSSVATQWLRDQGVGARAGSGTLLPTGHMQPATDQPLAPSVQPQAKPIQPPQSDLSLKPTMKPDVVQPDQVRPYNLDQLISDRAKAEADLDSMMSEMRGRMRGR